MGRSVKFLSPHVPANVAEFLGTSLLLKGEDSNQYQALFTELVRTVKPTDITPLRPNSSCDGSVRPVSL